MGLRSCARIDAFCRQAQAWAEKVRVLAAPHIEKARDWARTERGRVCLLVGGMAVTLLVSYWPTLVTMADRWWHEPQYSHGFLVPLFALAVLWFRRSRLDVAAIQPSWYGMWFLGAGLGLRLIGTALVIQPLETFSFLPTLAGLVMLLGGWAVWRWSWPAIAFLAFMLPLPFQLEIALAHPLRRLATEASTYVLQTLGFPALAEGNIIYIDQLKLGVVDACSGLGMLMTFFALAAATAMVASAPLLDRLVLVVSAIPVALIANIARITATAVAHSMFGEAAGKAVMHDLAGLLMMPLALLLLWLELRLLQWLFVLPGDEPAQPLSLQTMYAANNNHADNGHTNNGQALRLPRPDLREIPSLPAHGGG
jgi:exosortase